MHNQIARDEAKGCYVDSRYLVFGLFTPDALAVWGGSDIGLHQLASEEQKNSASTHATNP